MLARDYRPEDASAMDRLLGFNRAGDVRLERDRIIVAGPVGAPYACLVWRPMAFLHEFHCGLGLSARVAASALSSYALGCAMSRDYPIRDSIFLVESTNTKMRSFVEGEKAQLQSGLVYTLPLKPEVNHHHV